MKRKTVVALTLGLGLWGTGKGWADNPIDATITVTPIGTVNLALSVTTYAFGPMAVSAVAVAASSITLRNTGSVDVQIDKAARGPSAPSGWTGATVAQQAVVGPNRYALWVATGTAQPTAVEFSTATHLFDYMTDSRLRGIGTVTPTTLTTTSGALNEVYLWFRLDMPNQVSDQLGQEIPIHFTGIAQ